MRVVFVENDDSFSFNVVDLLPPGVELVRGSAAARAVRGADVVIIGPGPTDPHRAGLVTLVQQVLDAKTPMVGICLGHQALGLACGAEMTRSTPAHGKVARMHVDGSRFIPAGHHEVMRYHSLSLSAVQAPLKVTGTLDDGTVMVVEHETLPVLGLQFHPDSYATPDGRGFIDAFFRSLA